MSGHWLRPLRLAVLVVAVVLASACSVLSAPAGGSTHLTADFRNVAGLFVGNPVMVLGLQVGKVDTITPRGRLVEVHMSVDHDVRLPNSVMAVLVSPSVVTDRHIELTPVYTGGPALPDNTHLSADRTTTPIELDSVLHTIDDFAAALQPSQTSGEGPLSGSLLYRVVDGQGNKIRDTLQALSSALKVGVDNKDAISAIIVQLDQLTKLLADNDAEVRDFGGTATRLSQLLADQAPGLQATLAQLDDFVSNTSSVFGQYQNQLADSLTGLTQVTQQLRANAAGITEIVDVAPLLMQNLDRSVDRQRRLLRLHTLLGTSLSGEMVTAFCQRVQMRADGCRTGRVEDLGPDLGLTAALLGLTR